ncbi:hypothetical protein AaE_011634 [Aphanomyces astaci]|uniref:Uncharacterized protein n=1 Tax=Aphanomyces astaci TaxID=112090 RepID=A0A6A4ZHD0_APHAT|nr:hypothetical protein AaE_011634 [Aphanomyces astaci]
MLPPLHVEFKLRCAFHKSDELVLAAHEQQLLGHTLDMVAKTTSATITTAVLAGLDLSLHVMASVAGRKERENTRPAVVPAQQPPVHLLAATPAVRLAIPTVSTTNDRNSSVAPAQGYRPPPPVAAATAVPPAVASQAYNTSKEHAISLPEKTKERAQILDEAQQFQSKVKEHAVSYDRVYYYTYTTT